MTNSPCMDSAWLAALESEFEAPYMQSLKQFLRKEKDARKTIFPNSKEVFSAFNYTPLSQVKVVIIGQDPYHGLGQAHGLCFSVKPEIAIPPSLVNIYQELHADLGVAIPKHGCLIPWAKQGILLLNAVLTVEQGKAASHQGKGWETFTDRVITILNEQPRPIVFVLWGSYAQRKGNVIDENKHLVIRSVHPSPLSAYRGFFGSRPFSKINEFLIKTGQMPIDWSLPQREKIAEFCE
ncbi:MAG TPA: uracil-DNA glycosylase [Candidatus Berkiella sp.]|nr:uracil-DNA glycosylase [Candidatus Berkiella sp.]